MTVTLTIHHQNGTTVLPAVEGMALAPLLRAKGLLTLPCGVGKCAKCLIYAQTEPCEEERNLLTQSMIDNGLRLACYTKAVANLEIRIPHACSLRVLTQYKARPYEFQSVIRRVPFIVSKPTIDDQRTDLQRVLDACGVKKHALTQIQLKELPRFIRTNKEAFGLVEADMLLGYSAMNTGYGVIVDIGTTTVAALLVDMHQGCVVAARGEGNRQRSHGADVISRTQSQTDSMATSANDPLHASIINQLTDILNDLRQEVGFEDVDVIALTGNTTMMHFLCGFSAEHISKAPFIPVTLEAMRLSAIELGLPSKAQTYLMPGISGYIGADIVASLLAADAHKKQPPFLLVDLGTNAEIVLGIGGQLYACSAAAGPCFEGATLSCGMAGQAGAIDSVKADPDEGLVFTTLEHQPPKGICGSGVLDSVALLLEAGLVDETGRLEADDTPLGRRVVDDALWFTDTVCLTQKDIREIQLAKAAVRAGIEVLLQNANLTADSLGCLYLAGGFGSAISPVTAARIGLIPKELIHKVEVLGNAASFGALRYATEPEAPRYAQKIVAMTEYLELSAHADFTTVYVEQMLFPFVE